MSKLDTCCCSVAPCDPMDCTMPGFLVFHCLLELAQTHVHWGFPGGSDGKESAHKVGDPGSIPGSGSSPGEENVNPL